MKLENVKYCDSWFSKARGLMFSSRLLDGALVFRFNKEKKVGLHMWFVFFPIDVLYLDSNFNVVEIVEGFKPFSFYNPKCKSRYVVELPSGFISSNDVKVGNKISF